MAVDIPNIAAPSAQGDFIESWRSQNMLKKEMLEARMKQLENQYYPKKTESEIAHRQALTDEINKLLPGRVTELNQKNKYFPQTTETTNAFHQAQTNQINQMLPEKLRELILQNELYKPIKLSENAARNAIAAKNQAEADFAPTKYNIAQQNANARTQGAQNSASNAFRLWAQTPEGQQIIIKNPDMAKAVYNAFQQQAANYLPPKELKPLPEDATEKDIIKDIQKGAADNYEKTNLPADTKKRLYSGERFKVTVPSVLENFQKASVYFGPQGRAKLVKDQKNALSSGRRSPELQAYYNFEQGLEQLKVQGAFLEGVPADIPSRTAYAKIYDINKFFNNPTDAMGQLQYAIKLALMADKANQSSLSEIKAGNTNDKKIEELMTQGLETSKTNNTAPSNGKTIKVIRGKNGKLVRSDIQ